MQISTVFDRIIESESTRLGSRRMGQLSAMFGMSGSMHSLRILSKDGVSPVLTIDSRHIPTISKEKYAELGQRIFDSSISLLFLAWSDSVGGHSSNIIHAAKKLAGIYEEVLDVIIPVDDIVSQLNKMRC